MNEEQFKIMMTSKNWKKRYIAIRHLEKWDHVPKNLSILGIIDINETVRAYSKRFLTSEHTNTFIGLLEQSAGSLRRKVIRYLKKTNTPEVNDILINMIGNSRLSIDCFGLQLLKHRNLSEKEIIKIITRVHELSLNRYDSYIVVKFPLTENKLKSIMACIKCLNLSRPNFIYDFLRVRGKRIILKERFRLSSYHFHIIIQNWNRLPDIIKYIVEDIYKEVADDLNLRPLEDYL